MKGRIRRVATSRAPTNMSDSLTKLPHVSNGKVPVFERSSLLIAFIKEIWHPLFKIKDHLAEHAVGPAEPVEILSACWFVAGL